MASDHLVLLRHGQSVWNAENRFTGWVDVDLSLRGEEEARQAGELLLKNNRMFDVVFTSDLIRAIRTAEIVLEVMNLAHVPFQRRSGFRERSYGDLQGLRKDEVARLYSKEQVYRWRRGYHDRPPGGESLYDTSQRTIPSFQYNIEPLIKKRENVFIVAHGNSLRAIVMYLNQINEEEISKVEIPTGVPLIYACKNGIITPSYSILT